MDQLHWAVEGEGIWKDTCVAGTHVRASTSISGCHARKAFDKGRKHYKCLRKVDSIPEETWLRVCTKIILGGGCSALPNTTMQRTALRATADLRDVLQER